MDEQFLEQYKKIYLRKKMQDDALQKSWNELSRRLPAQDLPAQNLIFRYRFLFAGIILLLLAGTAGMAQASRSGELLYPVKILTNNVAAKIFGNPRITSNRLEKTVNVEPTKQPQPTEKEENEIKNDLKPEVKEIKEQNEPEREENEEDGSKQETQIKGVSTENTEQINIHANEASEIKKPNNGENGESNNKNKVNEPNNNNQNKGNNKNENRGKPN